MLAQVRFWGVGQGNNDRGSGCWGGKDMGEGREQLKTSKCKILQFQQYLGNMALISRTVLGT